MKVDQCATLNLDAWDGSIFQSIHPVVPTMDESFSTNRVD